MVYPITQRNAEQTKQFELEHEVIPTLVADAGDAARFAYDEFVYGQLRNSSTRKNYLRAVKRFLSHCERIPRSLDRIMPRDVGIYLDGLTVAPATKKLHLAALRRFKRRRDVPPESATEPR